MVQLLFRSCFTCKWKMELIQIHCLFVLDFNYGYLKHGKTSLHIHCSNNNYKHIPKSNSPPLKIPFNFLTICHIITIIWSKNSFTCFDTTSAANGWVLTWKSIFPDLKVEVKSIDVYRGSYLTDVIFFLIVRSMDEEN